jgi:hypothetical protein
MNVAATEAVCAQMKEELARIRGEYDSLATTLRTYKPLSQ